MAQVYMVTDTNLRSLMDYGSYDFPVKCYADDLILFDRQTIDWHWHRSFEVTYVSSGCITLSIMSENYSLKQGDLLFLNSGTIHRFSAERDGLLVNFLFAPEFISAPESRVYRDCVAPILQSGPMFQILSAGSADYKAVRSAFQDCISAEEASDSVLYSLNMHAAAVNLWQSLIPVIHCSTHNPCGISSVQQGRVQEMLLYIHQNYADRLSLQDIAASAGISTRECLRIFKICIQTSPMAYLNEYRIKMARLQMVDHSNSITEIAASCGFDNPGYFSKVFRKACGMAPREYRIASQKAENI